MWKDLKRRVPKGKGLPSPPQPGATSRFPGVIKIKDGWAAVTLDVANMQRAVMQPGEADPPYYGTCAAPSLRPAAPGGKHPSQPAMQPCVRFAKILTH